LSQKLKKKPNEKKLEFGRTFTDNMFIIDYTKGTGWHDPRIVPYEPLTLDPAAITFHYGQTVFEGLKAYRTKDNEVQLFRPGKNFIRMNHSNDRLVIPHIDEDFAVEAMKILIEIEKDWVRAEPATSLYVVPFNISTETYLRIAFSKS